MLSFIETPLFTRLVYDYLSDEEYAALQAHLEQDPESGEVVPGSGGCKKAALGRRWTGQAKRRAGDLLRPSRQGCHLMLTIYAKSEAENIPAHVLRKIRQELSDDED